MTLEQMIEQLNGLAGLDLEPEEATQLLNEGYAELCARSGWLRATSTSLVTVADQEDYTLPTDLYRIHSMNVAGVPQYAADEQTIAHIRAGNLDWTAPNGSYLYFLETDSDGTDHLTLYPTPTSAQTITLIYDRRPTDLTSSDSPLTPREFDRAIIRYAAAEAFSMLEDDEDLADRHRIAFERRAEDLRRLRNSRSSAGAGQARIIGVHV